MRIYPPIVAVALVVVLTLISGAIHGKITTIASGRTSSFANLDELYDLLKDELKDNPSIGEEIHSIFPMMPIPSTPQIPE